MKWAIDTETVARDPVILSTDLVCLTTTNGVGGVELFARDEALEWFWDHVDEAEFITANGPFEWCALISSEPKYGAELRRRIFNAYRQERVHDVLIRQPLIDNEAGHLGKHADGSTFRTDEGKVTTWYGLNTCAQIHGLGKKLDPYWRTRYGELKNVPPSQWPQLAVDYAKYDAELTWKVFHAQAATKARNLKQAPFETYSYWTTYLSSFRGFHINTAKAKETARKVEAKVLESAEYFKQIGFVREQGDINEKTKTRRPITASMVGKTNTAEIKERVLQAYGDAYPRTDAGAVKIDEQTCRDSGDPDLVKWAEDAVWRKYHSTYTPIFSRGTVHAKFNTLVSTGRMSSAGPNLQNIPQDDEIRSLFIPRPGFALLSIDFSGGELRTFAHVAETLVGYSILGELLRSGVCPHSQFAASLLGVPYADVNRLGKTKGTREYLFRSVAKVKHFGSLGLMGPDKFVQHARNNGVILCLSMGYASQCGVEVDRVPMGPKTEALCAACRRASADLHKAWLDLLHEFKEYKRLIGALRGVKSGRAEVEIVGTGMVRGGCNASAAANAHFQGLLARIFKDAYIQITDECYNDKASPCYGSRPLAPVHDEIIVEVPLNGREHEASFRMSEIMVRTGERYCPTLKGAWEAEPTLMAYWSKHAKTVFTPEGRLAVWKPE